MGWVPNRGTMDTNILVRAAGDEQGLAGKLLQEIVSGSHVLVSSPYILSEIARVLAYPRLQARWQLSEETVTEFVSRVRRQVHLAMLGRRCKVRAADQLDQWWRTSDITRLRFRSAPWKWARRVAAHHPVCFSRSR